MSILRGWISLESLSLVLGAPGPCDHGRLWYAQYHLKGVPSMPSSGEGLGHKQGITVTKSSGFTLLRSDLASPFIVMCSWTSNL